VLGVYLGGRKLDATQLPETSPGAWRPGVR